MSDEDTDLNLPEDPPSCRFCLSEGVELKEYPAPPFMRGYEPNEKLLMCWPCANTTFMPYGQDSCSTYDVAKHVSFCTNLVLNRVSSLSLVEEVLRSLAIARGLQRIVEEDHTPDDGVDSQYCRLCGEKMPCPARQVADAFREAIK